ncbi:MAG: hypothetical protein M1829_000551 [Trizodia sp. TS-e1964]|nr:MAG: hypothetical protein M1829_000551 [Trizodia sp. TS-e1964]
MADPISVAGLGLSAVSLLFQVFSGCVQGYQLLAEAHNMPEDYMYLNVRLKIEQHRLLRWADIAELSQNEALGMTNRGLLQDILHQKEMLLRCFGKYDDRYRELKKPLICEEDDELPPHSGADSLQIQFPHEDGGLLVKALDFIKKTRKVPKRLRWAKFDKEAYVILIEKLAAINDFLQELLSKSQQNLLLHHQHQNELQLMQLNDKLDHLVQIFTSTAEISSTLNTEAIYGPMLSVQMGLVPMSQNKVSKNSQLASLARFKALNTAQNSISWTEKIAKQLGIEVSAHQVHATELNRTQIKITESAKSSDLEQTRVEAIFQPGDNAPKQVWIEWKNYGLHILEPTNKAGDSPKTILGPDPRIVDRVRKLAILLHEPDKPDDFRVPRCLGFFDDAEAKEDQNRFGFVFEKPAAADPNSRPVSLLELFSRKPRPSLSKRIALANTVANCLQHLHSVNWMHKGLRSHNIIFFPTKDPQAEIAQLDLAGFSKPYLSGFDYARPASSGEMTEEPPNNPEYDIYRHPRTCFEGPREGFRKTFDIYSLGVILIEMAYWKPIDKIFGIENLKESAPPVITRNRDRLLVGKEFFEEIEFSAGTPYLNAVKACLFAAEAFGIPDNDPETSPGVGAKLQKGFYGKVVTKLASLSSALSDLTDDEVASDNTSPHSKQPASPKEK